MSPPFSPLPAPPWPHLAPGIVHLWQLHTPAAAPVIPQWQRWLTAEEQARAARFHRDRDRHTFILSRGGLRWLVGQYLGLDPAAVAFRYGDRGKPYLAPAHSPQSGPGLEFNLAHSGDWVVYGFTQGMAIGVDVEAIAPRNHGEGLIQRCLTAQEQQTLSSDPASRQRQFFSYWTAKEAYLKATGQGLSYPMASVEVAWTPDASQARLVQPSTAQDWTLQPWQPDEATAAAVCVADTVREICWGQVPLGSGSGGVGEWGSPDLNSPLDRR
jgi:4'-phosphopantetheinyl transferase